MRLYRCVYVAGLWTACYTEREVMSLYTQLDSGAIVAQGKLYEEARYDVSNFNLSVGFNGKGGVEYFSVADGKTVAAPIRFMSLVFNGQVQDVLLDKKVTMLGRRQVCEIALPTATLRIDQFLSERDCGIYTEYTLLSDDPGDRLEIGLVGSLFGGAVADGSCIHCNGSAFAADFPFALCTENAAVYFTADAKRPKCHTFILCEDAVGDALPYLDTFDAVHAEVVREIHAVTIPDSLDATAQALYCSAYWCALENYKEKGDYKGFMAGCRYLSPMRTYYRDSYYTVLSMYRGHLDKVRNQILTLTRGIGEDGACPSAVKSDWSDWWGDHYDSPSFLAMMLYDYINFTGDLSLLDQPVGAATVFATAVKAIEHLSGYCDGTGLLYKSGRYNKRDWADEVNRYGYVTYDQLLYARALYAIAQLYQRRGGLAEYRSWIDRFEAVKKAINEILWDEEKGYYVNFTNEDYIEDNLSIDTVLAAIFDIAEPERAKRLLTNMEALLETPHAGVPESFGSMCVYPFYKRIDAGTNKSTQCFDYHNGANWPYLSAMYAYAKRKYGMPYSQLLTLPFAYNLKKGNYTQIEYFSPYCKDGSLLQAWSGVAAFVLDEEISLHFYEDHPER